MSHFCHVEGTGDSVVYMTSWISIAATKLSRTRAHIHTSRIVKKNNQKTKNQLGMGIMLQTGNRWPAEGKKRQREGMPKKAREKCFPVLSTAAMSPSVIPLSSLGREKEGRGLGGVQRLDQRALASTSKRLTNPGRIFLKMAPLYRAKLAPAGCVM